ncbi:hypothetical protein D3C73_885540 [compost metagenome]
MDIIIYNSHPLQSAAVHGPADDSLHPPGLCRRNAAGFFRTSQSCDQPVCTERYRIPAVLRQSDGKRRPQSADLPGSGRFHNCRNRLLLGRKHSCTPAPADAVRDWLRHGQHRISDNGLRHYPDPPDGRRHGLLRPVHESSHVRRPADRTQSAARARLWVTADLHCCSTGANFAA